MRRGTIALTLLVGVAGAAAGLALAASGDQPDQPPKATRALTSGKLDLSRRSDPSLDRYVRTARRSTPVGAMTDAQRWLSSNARPIVMHDSDPHVSLYATGWGTKPKVAVYVNATGVNRWRPAQMQGARKWLVRKGKRAVNVDGWRMLDIRKPAARKWWLYGSDGKSTCHPNRDLRGALDLLACGYSGLWVDNVLTVPAQWFRPKPNISARSWGTGLVALLSELRAAKPPGTTVTINAHWTDLDFGWKPQPVLDPAAPLVRAAQQADQLVIEGGAIDPGLDYAAPTSTPWSYRRLLQFADSMHQQGVALQWEKTSSTDLTRNAAKSLGKLPSCRDVDYKGKQPAWRSGSPAWKAHVRSAAFNYASALLTGVGGDSVGDMCEYPGRGWEGYEQDLGTPVGTRYEQGPLLIREFSRGVVAVNSTGEPQLYNTPGGRIGVNVASTDWPQTGTGLTQVTIPARSAAVVVYR